jgi:hypothetical protein
VNDDGTVQSSATAASSNDNSEQIGSSMPSQTVGKQTADSVSNGSDKEAQLNALIDHANIQIFLPLITR